jgi:hypothetical protein
MRSLAILGTRNWLLTSLVIGALVIGVGTALVVTSSTTTSSTNSSNQAWAAPQAGSEYFVIYNNSTGHIDSIMIFSASSVEANLVQNGISCPSSTNLSTCVNSYPIWDALGGNQNANPVGNAPTIDVTNSPLLPQLLNAACACTNPPLGTNFHVDLTTHQVVIGPPS